MIRALACFVLVAASVVLASASDVFPGVKYSLYNDYWCDVPALKGNITLASGVCMAGNGLGDGNMAVSWKYTCYGNQKKVVATLYDAPDCTGNERNADTVPVKTCLRGVKFECDNWSGIALPAVARIIDNTHLDSLPLGSGVCQEGEFVNDQLTDTANKSFLISCQPGGLSAKIETFGCSSCACAGTEDDVQLPYNTTDPLPSGVLTCMEAPVWSTTSGSSSALGGGYIALIVIAILICCGIGGFMIYRMSGQMESRQQATDRAVLAPKAPGTEEQNDNNFHKLDQQFL